MSTLASPKVAGLLQRLYAEADRNDPAAFEQFRAAEDKLGRAPGHRERAELMREIYMPVEPDIGRLLYVLARSRGAKLIVEFGTSFGLSGIHLAAALRDNGGGRLVTTEFDKDKAARAEENFKAAGLFDLVEIRVGDAFETLSSAPAADIDMLLLDGWKQLYLPMLKLIDRRLAPAALVIADDLAIAKDAVAPYLAFVRDAANGYTSVEVPLGDRIEISVKS